MKTQFRALAVERERFSLGLPSRTLSHRARSIREPEFGRAIETEPDQDMRSICPEKRTHFAGHPHGRIHRQTLQGLQIEHTIVECALHPVILVNTLPLSKISFHKNHHFLRAVARHSEHLKNVGISLLCETNGAKDERKRGEALNFASSARNNATRSEISQDFDHHIPTLLPDFLFAGA